MASGWECEVCGYVHEGPNPPNECPVCGAGAEDFTQTSPPPAAPVAASRSWVCSVCGYLHEGDDPPDECPVCGVDADEFEPAAPPSFEETSTGLGPIVVVGAGIAGATAAEHARATAWDAPVTLVSAEPAAPLYRLNLTRLLAGEITEGELALRPAEWFHEQRIELIEGRVASIDRRRRTVALEDGRLLPFSSLVLTVGARPFVPPIPGAERSGVLSLRTLADARAILEQTGEKARCVCIGGGLLGLETAGALASRGVEVTVVEGSEHLLSRQLAPPAGAALLGHVEAAGIAVRLGARVEAIVGDDAVDGVKLADGEILPAEVVVLSTGVRPDLDLARACELETARGVVVDDAMTTSDSDVFAAGDAAEHRGVLYGLWTVAMDQGAVAGANAAGGSARFSGVAPSTVLKVLDVDVFSAGRHSPLDESDQVLQELDDGRCVRVLVRDGLLVGANVVGAPELAGPLRSAIADATPIDALEGPVAALLARHAPTD
jgi:nitrite reductase (NADH) large subunit